MDRRYADSGPIHRALIVGLLVLFALAVLGATSRADDLGEDSFESVFLDACLTVEGPQLCWCSLEILSDEIGYDTFAAMVDAHGRRLLHHPGFGPMFDAARRACAPQEPRSVADGAAR